MNNHIVQAMYQTFVRRGFATLRFNFRGVGKSQGVFDNAVGELSDAASALDWVQSIHPEAQTTWIAGYSFGALIGMQLLMRRPEIKGFISVAPPANMYDFTFLAPCPSSGIVIQGTADEVATPSASQKLVDKLRTQRHITIHHDEIRVPTISLNMKWSNSWGQLINILICGSIPIRPFANRWNHGRFARYAAGIIH